MELVLGNLASGARKRRAAKKSQVAEAAQTSSAGLTFQSDEERLASFGRALDALRAEVEAKLGAEDAAHLQRVAKASRALEIAGRALIHASFDPVTFGAGVASLSAHKMLELMEIGHNVLHSSYDRIPGCEAYRAQDFKWKAPIDEKSWCVGHNVRHHQYTNIAGKDPDLDFGGLRLSTRIPHKLMHHLQPLTNLFSWAGFAVGINLHVTGLLDVYLGKGEPHVLPDRSWKSIGDAHRTFLSKMARYYGREYVLFPLLAGPFFWKTLLGNALSEMARDLYAGAIIYCGHVGAEDFPADARAASRPAWYAMQVEAAIDLDLPPLLSLLGGALDKQIEHHLFQRLPPNRLREIAPQVREICEQHGVRYRSGRWPERLRSVLKELRSLSVAMA